MKCNDYMEAVRLKTRSGSIYAAAKLLQLDEQTVRDWAKGRRLPDAFGCVRIAEVLDLPPMQVIADIEAEREGDTPKAARWRDLGKKFASSVLTVGFITTGTIDGKSPLPGDCESSGASHSINELQIMRQRARGRDRCRTTAPSLRPSRKTPTRTTLQKIGAAGFGRCRGAAQLRGRHDKPAQCPTRE
jgi:hypothetical protein